MSSSVDIFKLSNLESVITIAKHIIAQGAADVSEHEFSRVIMGHAKLNKRDKESDAAAFNRIFTTPENIELRRAHAITKSYPAMMDTTSRSTEVGSSETDDDSAAVLAQLNDLVAEQRRLAPTLSDSALFERVFMDPKNAKLAQATYPNRLRDFDSAATK